jgi:hypothetical protein
VRRGRGGEDADTGGDEADGAPRLDFERPEVEDRAEAQQPDADALPHRRPLVPAGECHDRHHGGSRGQHEAHGGRGKDRQRRELRALCDGHEEQTVDCDAT